MKCLGLYCLLDANQARDHVIFFLSLLDKDTPEISLASISILFDFLTYFGPKALGDTYTEDEEAVDLAEKKRIAKERARARRRKSAKKRLDMKKADTSDIEAEEEEEELDSKKGTFILPGSDFLPRANY